MHKPQSISNPGGRGILKEDTPQGLFKLQHLEPFSSYIRVSFQLVTSQGPSQPVTPMFPDHRRNLHVFLRDQSLSLRLADKITSR